MFSMEFSSFFSEKKEVLRGKHWLIINQFSKVISLGDKV